ncbi:ATP synthase F1 subcomplex delta subunit [Thermanaeromonas toyohensis ToBE]|uniref:ATP synthase subunit delta n=1 Tax=Thermanaeromonas toyohensis ToBE TaxID=698762 RepID=A0A1W1W387_9FIRM|nr:ATP synthase F1 subunit delta [Thermanaeromonas toyohensis]SMC00088.1 ATP synthase F1 subcomplex delta subunit [Thermanaeromonas toyohensis ToBE]
MSSRVAKRYAQALYSLAQERGNLSRVKEELGQVVESLEKNEDFRRLLYHQLIAPKQKEELLKEVFPHLEQDTRRFLGLVLEKRRERLLPEIVYQFRRLVDWAEGIVEAEVTVAFPLPESLKEELKGKLSRLLGRKVRLKIRLDQEILGGLVVRVGDRILDASIKKRLELFKESLRRVELKP